MRADEIIHTKRRGGPRGCGLRALTALTECAGARLHRMKEEETSTRRGTDAYGAPISDLAKAG